MINKHLIEAQTLFEEDGLVSDVIENYEGFHPTLEGFAERWYEAKKNIIKMFGNKTIYTFPEKITLHLSEEEKEQKINNFTRYVYYNLKACGKTQEGIELANFIRDNVEDFFDNRLKKEYNKGKYRIPSGSKFIKSFKFFDIEEKQLRELQDTASRVIQENKVEGYLCLSVHPLDYLTISENDCNWTSCHSLDGYYRAGNFSYMFDSSTIVCYLKSRDESEYLHGVRDNYSWNNKKWRALVHIAKNKESFIFNKHYPFHSDIAEDFLVKNMIEKVFNKTYSVYVNHEETCDVLTNLLNVGLKLNSNQNYSLFYWDYNNYSMKPKVGNFYISDKIYEEFFTYSSPELYLDLRYNDQIDFSKRIIGEFNVGASVPCLYCGEDDITFEDSLLCDKHELEFGTSGDENIITCEDCGARVVYDDAVYLYEYDYYVCSDCFNRYVKCSNCDTILFNEDAVYDEETECFYCPDCYRDIIAEREEHNYVECNERDFI